MKILNLTQHLATPDQGTFARHKEVADVMLVHSPHEGARWFAFMTLCEFCAEHGATMRVGPHMRTFGSSGLTKRCVVFIKHGELELWVDAYDLRDDRYAQSAMTRVTNEMRFHINGE